MHLLHLFVKKGLQFRHKFFELSLNVSKVLAGSCIALEQQINSIVGVVTNGLFASRPADILLLGSENGVKTFTAS